MIHSFTCAGVLVSQYTNLCSFAGIGNVGFSYIRQGLKSFAIIVLRVSANLCGS